MQPKRSRSSDTHNVQEGVAAIQSGETEKEEEWVRVTDMSERDTGKSMATEPISMPTVEKPKAFSLSQYATRHVTDELYGKILMDARVRDVYDHELVRKTTTSPEQIINHLLLRFPEPTTYQNFDLHYLISGNDKYRPSTTTSLLFEEWGDGFLKEGIHHERIHHER